MGFRFDLAQPVLPHKYCNINVYSSQFKYIISQVLNNYAIVSYCSSTVINHTAFSCILACFKYPWYAAIE